MYYYVARQVLLNIAHTLNGIYATEQNVKDHTNLVTVLECLHATQIKFQAACGLGATVYQSLV